MILVGSYFKKEKSHCNSWDFHSPANIVGQRNLYASEYIMLSRRMFWLQVDYVRAGNFLCYLFQKMEIVLI